MTSAPAFPDPFAPPRENLTRAAELLWEPVPAPYIPPPTAQASWKTLKPGQLLVLTQTLHVNQDVYLPGAIFHIARTTNVGAHLVRVPEEFFQYSSEGSLESLTELGTIEIGTKKKPKLAPPTEPSPTAIVLSTKGVKGRYSAPPLPTWAVALPLVFWGRDDWQATFERQRKPKVYRKPKVRKQRAKKRTEP